ncbi:MAG: AbrB/MazE/SpoVT family DNA-binding domain-containing protein [Deltaproteobacteria bacterium]|nr:AbrB/MazE/SpoVT family DNA-binding domain-containing protein [Deltaproteobacteria bacterium]MBW2065320.1 AbrB/MazE/SpoVT family DNA-binding domain-containing protein [Deltaproteobacteria bacterium]
MLAKKTSKNQITLPKEIVRAFPNVEYFDVSIDGNSIRLVPVRITPVPSSLDTIREKIKRLGLTEKDVDEAVEWARSEKR